MAKSRTVESKTMGPMGIVFLMALLLPLVTGYLGRAYGQAALWGARALVLPLPEKDPANGLSAILWEKKTLTPREANAVMAYLGRRYAPVVLALTVIFMCLAHRRDPGRRFSRYHDMWSLLKISAKHFPCLSPIVKTGPITKMASFGGQWAIAATPLQFVLENGLLLDPSGQPYRPGEVMDYRSGLPMAGNPALGRQNSLDVAKLRELLISQLGRRFGGRPDRLTGYRRALAAALLAHAMDMKTEAMAIFDSLSVSWDPKTHWLDDSAAESFLAGILPAPARQSAPGPITAPGPEPDSVTESDPAAKPLSGQAPLPWAGHGPGLADLMGREAFENVWFMTLLELARVKGALPTSLWIWLKPTDRLLFYALNQVGGGVAWVEAAGAFSHREAERKAEKALAEPAVGPAMASMEKTLKEDGYLPKGPEDEYLSLKKGYGHKSYSVPEIDGNPEAAEGKAAEEGDEEMDKQSHSQRQTTSAEESPDWESPGRETPQGQKMAFSDFDPSLPRLESFAQPDGRADGQAEDDDYPGKNLEDEGWWSPDPSDLEGFPDPDRPGATAGPLGTPGPGRTDWPFGLAGREGMGWSGEPDWASGLAGLEGDDWSGTGQAGGFDGLDGADFAPDEEETFPGTGPGLGVRPNLRRALDPAPAPEPTPAKADRERKKV
ncbi:MAG: hypothetical protein LBJ61_03645 [Deltaproteobacteria bacterium]|jgi:hypothetical protein|nr:hypothetical protein [Deltaproteobacteria bacterium]